MGPIEDRTREHLVSTDNGIIMTRQRLMRAARNLQKGILPPGRDAAQQSVRAFSAVLPRDMPIADAPQMRSASTRSDAEVALNP